MKPSITAALLIAAAPALAQRVEAPPGFDAYVAQVLSTFTVPGVAIAIVKDGQVVLARGYGVKALGRSERVDSLTRFGIASNTKAFTASALGILVERKLIEWDQPVVKYLPNFAMSDPYVTRTMTVRDLLVHRSGLGLGAGDLLFWPPSTFTRAEIVQRLRYLPIENSFRTAYAYDNVLYVVAGQLIEKVAGKTWEEFVRAEIIAPVGMSTSGVRLSEAAGGGNTAVTHAEVDGRVIAVKPFTADNTNSAGGIISNANDMARWMVTQLDSGRTPDGKRLWSPRTTRELWTGVTPMPFGPPDPELAPMRNNFRLYALGFDVRDYRGLKLVEHTGGLPGYVSLLMMIPDQRLGVAVLTNQESGYAFRSIGMMALDHYLGVQPSHDWLGGYRAVWQRDMKSLATATVTQTARDTTKAPSLPLSKLAMTYTDKWYGDVTVGLENGRLTMAFSRSPDLRGVLEHQQGNAFLVRWNDRSLRADATATFEIAAGQVTRLKLVPLPGVDFSFDFQDLDLRPASSKRVP
jgi:CubicO group peptidase (beta-lactamase class C family)